MEKPLEYHDGAREDFDDSFDWYAERSEQAAKRFAFSVDAAVKLIVANPGQFPSTLRGCRYYQLRRFPFRIIFLEQPDRIVVIAVAHAKRRPNYWRKRV